jgi:hypothetical protein
MAKGKLNLKGLSTADKIARARQLIQELSDHLESSAAPSPLAQITNAADALETAYSDMHNARQLALSKTSVVHEKEGVLDSILQKLAGELERVNCDAEILPQGGSSQFKSITTSVNLLEGHRSNQGALDGESGLNWSNIGNVRRYFTGHRQAPVLPLRVCPKNLS